MASYTINGEQRRTGGELPTLAGLLEELGLIGKKIAVEKNGDIVPKSRHRVEKVTDGDVIEIVTAVGGG